MVKYLDSDGPTMEHCRIGLRIKRYAIVLTLRDGHGLGKSILPHTGFVLIGPILLVGTQTHTTSPSTAQAVLACDEVATFTTVQLMSQALS